MKKFIVSILAVFYLCSSTGATVHLHYCMGKLVNWNLLHKDSDRCNKCGMKKTGAGKGCCNDEHKFIKIEKDQKTQSAYQVMQLFAVAIPVSDAGLTDIPFSVIAEENPVSNAPPRNGHIAIYILHCFFRI